VQTQKPSLRLIGVSTIVAVAILLTGSIAATQQETVLHSFGVTRQDGYDPNPGLTLDAAGNLYGTTFSGGAYISGGTVFKLTLQASGSWDETIVYSFIGGSDGKSPAGSLIFDDLGNIYGTTGYGGIYCGAFRFDCGAVFELSQGEGGVWTNNPFFSFNGTDGANPSGMIFNGVRNYYGATHSGGAHGNGTVFELAPESGGDWIERVVHSFYMNGTDGIGPDTGLIVDAADNIYGTTFSGGVVGGGIVFELMPTVGTPWTEKVLHNFGGGRDGTFPAGSLTMDSAGNLYGTTIIGGAQNLGTVFELTPTASGRWKETILYSFSNTGTDGYRPEGGLTLDASDNLYGTTYYGGIYGYGTAFKLLPAAGGSLTEIILHSFDNNGTDGTHPLGNLIFDGAGNLYGVAGGGANNGGTVFEITP
jgi:uncharacterized repeat protein (TIGR03803 family)